MSNCPICRKPFGLLFNRRSKTVELSTYGGLDPVHRRCELEARKANALYWDRFNRRASIDINTRRLCWAKKDHEQPSTNPVNQDDLLAAKADVPR